MALRYAVDPNVLLRLSHRNHPHHDLIAIALRRLVAQGVEPCFAPQNVVARQNDDLLLNQVHALFTKFPCLGCKPGCMLRLLRLLLVLVTRCSCSRRDLLLENLALRQQLITLKQKHQRPRVAVSYKLFWVLLRRFWPEWKQALIFVQPETIVRWHRADSSCFGSGFRGIELRRAGSASALNSENSSSA